MSASTAASVAVPNHIGIIPDGNRRWAKANGKSSLEGHQKGLEVAREVCLAALDRGVHFFTMYAFSTENWNRTQEEVGYLMKLFEKLLVKELDELDKAGVRFRLIGSREGLPKSLVKAIDGAEARTAGNQRGTMSLCLNYGGEQELTEAAAAVVKDGGSLRDHLYAPDVPDLDLIIRTSGEERTSGFMLARSAYAELLFIDKNWPDFSVADLDAAIAEFSRRQRRFGA
jgi:undecaprenyl diphosphate synthase